MEKDSPATPAQDKERLRGQLKNVSFCAGLSERTVDRLTGASTIIDSPAGTVLFREGTTNQTLFLICSGAVALEMGVPARGSVRLLTLGPGDLVAWSAVLGRGQMTTSAIVTLDAQLLAISAPALIELCDSNHDVGYQFMQRMAQALSRRLLATRLQLLDLYSPETPVIKS